MTWGYVFLAATFEIIGVVGMKKMTFKINLPGVLAFIGGFVLSYYFLYQSFQTVQTSVAYAVFVGIGTAGAVLVNMFFFGEKKTIKRLLSTFMIIIGVVGLKAIS